VLFEHGGHFLEFPARNNHVSRQALFFRIERRVAGTTEEG
jgi:hypothetical protein